MARTYTEGKQYELGTVSNSIVDKPYKEKSQIKADAFSKLKIKNFTVGDYVIDIKGKEVSGDALMLKIKASKNGQPIFIDNPCYFYNPPILIQSGTWYKEWDDELEQEMEYRNYKEDLEGALKELAYQLVELADKNGN